MKVMLSNMSINLLHCGLVNERTDFNNTVTATYIHYAYENHINHAHLVGLETCSLGAISVSWYNFWPIEILAPV